MALRSPANFDFFHLSQKRVLNPKFKKVKKLGGSKMTFFQVGEFFFLIGHNSAYFWSWEMFETIFRILRPSAFR